MKEITVTEPVFVHSFACAGSECRDNCCKEWDIIWLEKPIVNRYLKNSPIEIRHIAATHIEMVKKNFHQWGKMKFAEHGSCAFMDEKGWCGIHKTLGASALSHTCASYPRLQAIFKHEIQKTMTLSCPEATRLLLTSRDAMLLRTEKKIQSEANDAPVRNQQRQLLNLMCATIMKHSGVNISAGFYGITKLFLLSEKYQTEKNKLQPLEKAFSEIIRSLSEGGISNELAQIKPDHNLQWALVFRLLSYFATEKSGRSWKTMQHYSDKLAVLQAESARDNTTQQLMVKLSHVWQQSIVPQLNEQEIFIENYIQYRIYNDIFPGYDDHSDMKSLYLLVAEWFFLKSLISACVLTAGKVVADDFINIIYSFHALTKHNSMAIKVFFNEIDKTKVHDDISLIYLLK